MKHKKTETKSNLKSRRGARYGMGSNVLFMVRLAMESVPTVNLILIVAAVLEVALALMDLYAAPIILDGIEQHIALPALIARIALFTLGLISFHALSRYMAEVKLAGRIEVRIHIIMKLHEKLGSCSYPLLENQKFMDLEEKAFDSVGSNKASEAVWNTMQDLLKNGICFVIYLILLANVDWFIIIMTLITTAAGYFVTNYINGWGYRHRGEEAQITRKIAYINEKACNHILAKDIRIFGMADWLKELHDKYLYLYHDFCMKRERKYLLADFTDIMLGVLRNGIAYAYILYITIDGQLGVAQFLLYFSAVGGFTAWVSGIMKGFSALYKQSLDLSVIREFIDFPEVFLMEGKMALEPEKDGCYTIEFRNVSFTYPGAENPVFRHLNLTIPAGEKLAIVGLNGAGKTTLVKLMCGFYDPDEGAVLLNGTDIRTFNRRDYYKLFGAVFQDYSILAGSVAANIAVPAKNIDMERVRLCIVQAGLADKIESLPQGCETNLVKSVYEDAPEFSGGEYQRLLLARLLYQDRPMIVLDEPTAALDAIAESDIYNRYNELTQGHTAVYISHRLASTRFCDRIILIDKGGIAEEGTHDELLARNGIYASLFAIQSKYYKSS